MITSKQVNLLMALGARKKLYGDELLEFLEYECNVNVTKLEEVPAADVSLIVKRLEAA